VQNGIILGVVFLSCFFIVMLSVIILGARFIYCFSKCHFAKCRFVECPNVVCFYAAIIMSRVFYFILLF
jgi:hypothetical protein